MTIGLYMQKPVEVEAAQFFGWQTPNFEGFMIWLNKYKPFYVPRGYEHRMRKEGEKDRSRGDTLEGADAYLVLEIDGKKVRVENRSWIVKFIDGRISILDAVEFNKQYDRSSNVGVI